MNTAESGKHEVGQLVGYGVPFVVFVVFGIFALWFYYRTRAWWMERLESSRGGRFVFFITANFVVLLFLGALCDKVDITEVFDGHISANQTTLLSLTAMFLVLFFYLQGCWFNREEQLTLAATAKTAAFAELECQRNFLAGLLNHLNGFIGKYNEFIVRYLTKGEFSQSEADEHSLTNRVYELLSAVIYTFQGVQRIGPDARLFVVLLRPTEDGYLHPYASYDGQTRGFFNNEYSRHCEEFNLGGHHEHITVKAHFESIRFWNDSNGGHDGQSRDRLYLHPAYADSMKSMVAIPLEIRDVQANVVTPSQDGDGHVSFSAVAAPQVPHRWVLWFWCDRPFAFVEDHLWKAQQIQRLLAGRISLLRSQQLLLDAFRLRFAADTGGIISEPASSSPYTVLQKDQVDSSLTAEPAPATDEAARNDLPSNRRGRGKRGPSGRQHKP